jgi:1,4-dihydroxy-2-naphthoyl-CoA hydrolase
MSSASNADGFGALLGFTFIEKSPNRVEITWVVESKHLQPYGMAHGGVYCSAVEHAASMGAALNAGDQFGVVGISNLTDFLRPVGSGELRAVATPIHRGHSQQLWLVEVLDRRDRLVARGQVRFQHIPKDSASVRQPGAGES